MGGVAVERAAVERIPGELVGLVLASLQPEVRRITADLGFTLELSDAPDLVVARIENRCPEIVLVDTDLLGCPEALCRRARSLRPDVTFVALSCFWSEREEMLRACADVIVHKPLRDAEWRDLFGRVRVIDVTIPAALGRTPHLAA